MAAKKDLAEYLADYLEERKILFVSVSEKYGDIETEIDVYELHKILKQGFEESLTINKGNTK